MKSILLPSFRLLLVSIMIALAVACSQKPSAQETATVSRPFAPPAQPYKFDAEDGQWTMPAKNYASTRFSALSEINTGNVKNLKEAWNFSTGVVRGHEAAPLVVNNTMYIVTPYPNILYALDLTKGGAVKWKYEPKPAPFAQGVACCDVVNRGAAYSNGRIFFNTLDNNTVAVDAETGAEVWKTSLGDINKGETITMAPLVVKDKVLVGNSGGEMGVRGWITAVNAATGAIAWRAYNTGPDKDCLIGPRFKPFYAQDRGTDLGVSTWPPDAWKTGGGTVWGWISYDPEQNLVYHGTANPGPWNPAQRPGDNKWTCGIFARDADTGEAVWFYQFSPHDLHDYDGINEQILLDMPMNGTTRKVLIRPERNGYMYVMDRTSGQVLSANPFVHITTSSGVDLQTGLLQMNPEKSMDQVGKVVRDICPASPGAKDWQPSAFSPITGLVYLPHNNLCQDAESVETGYIAGTPYVGMIETEARLNLHWTITGGYLLSDVLEFPANTSLEGLRIPQVPKHQATFQVRYSNPSLVTLGVQARAGGQQFDDDQNRFPLGRYFTMDAIASHRLTSNFDVFVAAENLLNQRYLTGRTPVTTIGPPVLIRGGIRFRLNSK